tara:strand:- start:1297 stop:1866 length:570 start_codon:yes stop_codon:yes gene_type:complete
MLNLIERIFFLLILLLILPIILIISFIIIIVDNQFPFFVQERVGLNGEKFYLFKFKTMIVNEKNGVITPVEINDERVTKLGEFLRRTFIDEIPQIMNIVLGDIKLVGPRPLASSQNREYLQKINGWERRYKVKPGITGLSQSLFLRGGGSIEKYKLILKIDLWYINNKSFSLNLKIIFKTIKSLIKEIF